MALVRVHPAFGLRTVDPTKLVTPYTEEQLGSEWLDTEERERESLERSFFTTVLVTLADQPESRFRADLPLPYERRVVHAAAGASNVLLTEERGELRGLFTAPIGAALVTTNPEILAIEVQGRDVFYLHDAWSGAVMDLLPLELESVLRALRQNVRK